MNQMLESLERARKGTRIRLSKTVQVADVKIKEKLLDIGCGNKHLLYYLPEDIDYTGIDLRDDADVQCDIEKGLPNEIKNNKYDIIFLNEIIEHIQNFKNLLIDCKNILSENGRIIISTPSNNRILLSDFKYTKDESHDHIHCFRKSNMYNLAEITGLKVTKIIGTYIHIPSGWHRGICIPVNQSLYSDKLIYILEEKKNEIL